SLLPSTCRACSWIDITGALSFSSFFSSFFSPPLGRPPSSRSTLGDIGGGLALGAVMRGGGGGGPWLTPSDGGGPPGLATPTGGGLALPAAAGAVELAEVVTSVSAARRSPSRPADVAV